MRPFPTFATFALALLPVARAQTPPLSSLDSLRDRARPLLLFAPRPNDPQLRIQLRNLQHAAPAVTERDIIPIAILAGTPSPTEVTLTTNAAAALRRTLHIPIQGFTVILIGKDGGEKLRSARPISIQHLLDTIDAMPMRKDEMNRHRP